jgi:DNA-directed RNA polymerase subunit RPC12/RpoP
VATCNQCGEDKPLHDFFERKNGGTSSCKACEKEQIREWRKNNKEKQAEINRRAKLKINYGITPEQYEELLDKQNHRCAICDRHEDEFKIKLCVDHNHLTQEIRGLLCTYCNHRVIGRHRDGVLLRKMADYVEGGTGWFVPKKRPKKRRRKRNV